MKITKSELKSMIKKTLLEEQTNSQHKQFVKNSIVTEKAITTRQANSSKLGLFIIDADDAKLITLIDCESYFLALKTNELDIKNHIVGTILLDRTESCDSETWFIGFVVANKGYGPLLYDIAMSTVYPEFVAPDRDEVSDSAANVWRYYMTKRNDVEKAPLESEEDCGIGKRDDSEKWTKMRFRLSKKMNISTLLSNGKKLVDMTKKSTKEPINNELIFNQSFEYFYK